MRLPRTPNRFRTGFLQCLFCTVLISVSVPFQASAQESVNTHSATIPYNGKVFSANWVSVDLSDPYLRIRPVIASDGIGHVESFSSMMERSHAVAGINGTFFDAYEKDASIRYPNGLLIGSGSILHSGSNASLLVLADHTAHLENVETQQQISVNHEESTYRFTAWGINKYYGDSVDDQVVWYTRSFGTQVPYTNSVKVVIENNVVTAITEDPVTIPEDGQVCLIGHSANNQTYVLPNIHIGDTMSMEASLSGTDLLPMVDAAVGAGPRLLSDGNIDIDYTRDGFTDPKITTQANARSFIGVDASGQLLMGTVSSATISDMAHVLQQLGITDAMNLDGGASSALYARGTIITSPGRELSNALVVERLQNPQIQLTVNGQFVQEFRGYLTEETSMVPMRGILERIGAKFEWDGTARELTVQYGTNHIRLHPDDRIMLWNGNKVVLPAAPEIVEGHIYMPLRAVIESLGGKVTWDSQLYRASLTFP
ncbi:phosphodiester glycosidase family protein [Paenibacillus hexagrammi]|uniref:Phosphodiester glycosidase family protein n=1 Tax=Paenibacillus hexagrammi TaxID=2908839 RepID=A0ABY3SF27_9BACL|nr:phosphodiester glycosidase family protein [Paenibacillus sp. YPD9-1]UJF32598.1 phosphodiester glycosidase family protein [Paenibacillus sp. YPD9-1]